MSYIVFFESYKRLASPATNESRKSRAPPKTSMAWLCLAYSPLKISFYLFLISVIAVRADWVSASSLRLVSRLTSALESEAAHVA